MWWWTLGFVVHFCLLFWLLSPPIHPPISFEQSHKSTNSHLPHTLHARYAQPNPQTLNSGRFRVEPNVETAGFTAEPVGKHFSVGWNSNCPVWYLWFSRSRGKNRSSKCLRTYQQETRDKVSLSSPYSFSVFFTPCTVSLSILIIFFCLYIDSRFSFY